MAIQDNYKVVGKDVALSSSCTKAEIKDFKKYQEMLDKAKNIKLFDMNQDGKFDDNEFLLIENQDGTKAALFNPKKGVGPNKVKEILKAGGLTATSEIKQKDLNYLKFFKIGVESIENKNNEKPVTNTDKFEKEIEPKKTKEMEKAKETEPQKTKEMEKAKETEPQKTKEMEKAKEMEEKLKKQGFDFSIEICGDHYEITLLHPKKGTELFGLLSIEVKPSFGELKKILNLPDGTFSENKKNNIYELANRRNAPGRLSGRWGDGSNHFDEWTLEPNKPFYIPIKEQTDDKK